MIFDALLMLRALLLVLIIVLFQSVACEPDRFPRHTADARFRCFCDVKALSSQVTDSGGEAVTAVVPQGFKSGD